MQDALNTPNTNKIKMYSSYILKTKKNVIITLWKPFKFVAAMNIIKLVKSQLIKKVITFRLFILLKNQNSKFLQYCHIHHLMIRLF